jgi:ABC-type glycerol-3-phosphate transport system substrate-binding protein
MSRLLPASLTHQGPDVAIQIDNSTPVNFALRNAAQDITVFSDYKDVMKRFYDSAVVPYKFADKIYALPETQTFGMLFYRKDIFEEMGFKVPETWDDLFDLIPELEKNNMQFALPLEQNFARMPTMAPNAALLSLLFQKGGKLYSEDSERVELDSEESMSSFRQWTEFYTSYKMPVTFNFMNRFRTGEMPMGIADYSLYNSLSVSAPELRGMWEFIPIPGTKTDDGAVRRDEPGGGSAVMMLNTSENKDYAWEFMKWWTSTEAQLTYAKGVESTLGTSARYATANREALSLLPWKKSQLSVINSQLVKSKAIPEVPGGYYVNRQINNAFRMIVVQKNPNIRDVLLDYEAITNEEINQKRKEFNMD